MDRKIVSIIILVSFIFTVSPISPALALRSPQAVDSPAVCRALGRDMQATANNTGAQPNVVNSIDNTWAETSVLNWDLIPVSQRNELLNQLRDKIKDIGGVERFEQLRKKVIETKIASPLPKLEKEAEYSEPENIIDLTYQKGKNESTRKHYETLGKHIFQDTAFVIAAGGLGTRLRNSSPDWYRAIAKREGVFGKVTYPMDMASFESPLAIILKNLAQTADELGVEKKIYVPIVYSGDSKDAVEFELGRIGSYIDKFLDVTLLPQSEVMTFNERGEIVTRYNKNKQEWQIVTNPNGTLGILQALEAVIESFEEKEIKMLCSLFGDDATLTEPHNLLRILGASREGNLALVGAEKISMGIPPGGTIIDKEVTIDGERQRWTTAVEVLQRTGKLDEAELHNLGLLNTGGLLINLDKPLVKAIKLPEGVDKTPIDLRELLKFTKDVREHIAFKPDKIPIGSKDTDERRIDRRNIEWYLPELVLLGTPELKDANNNIIGTRRLVVLPKVDLETYGAIKDHSRVQAINSRFFEGNVRWGNRMTGKVADDFKAVWKPESKGDALLGAIITGVAIEGDVHIEKDVEINSKARVVIEAPVPTAKARAVGGKGLLIKEGVRIGGTDTADASNGDIIIANREGEQIIIPVNVIINSRNRARSHRECLLINKSLEYLDPGSEIDTMYDVHRNVIPLSEGEPDADYVRYHVRRPYDGFVTITTVDVDNEGNPSYTRQWAGTSEGLLSMIKQEQITTEQAGEILLDLYKESQAIFTEVRNIVMGHNQRLDEMLWIIELGGMYIGRQHLAREDRSIREIKLRLVKELLEESQKGFPSGCATTRLLSEEGREIAADLLYNLFKPVVKNHTDIIDLTQFADEIKKLKYSEKLSTFANTIAALKSERFKEVADFFGNEEEAMRWTLAQSNRFEESFADTVLGDYMRGLNIVNLGKLKEELNQLLDPKFFVDSFSGVRVDWGEKESIDFKKAAVATLRSFSATLLHIHQLKQKGLLKDGDEYRYVVARDTRPLNMPLKDALVLGVLAAAKFHYLKPFIIDTEFLPTPMAECAVRTFNAHGGVIITASHSPLNIAGFKFMTAEQEEEPKQKQEPEKVSAATVQNGALLSAETMGQSIKDFRAIIDMAMQSDKSEFQKVASAIEKIKYEELKTEPIEDRKRKLIEEHMKVFMRTLLGETEQSIMENLDGMVLALDPDGGAACKAYRSILDVFTGAAEVVEINGEYGEIRRDPEPSGDAFEPLIRLMKEKKAKLGGATDLDADRLNLAAYSEQLGRVENLTPQETAGAMLAMQMARLLEKGVIEIERENGERVAHYKKDGSERKVAVVINDASSGMIYDIAGIFGVKAFTVETGEIIIHTRMVELQQGINTPDNERFYVPLGIEASNGGCLFATETEDGKYILDTCRNGLFTMLFAALIQSKQGVEYFKRYLAEYGQWRTEQGRGLTLLQQQLVDKAAELAKQGKHSLWDVASTLPKYYTKELKMEGVARFPQGIMKDKLEEKFAEFLKSWTRDGGKYWFVNYEETEEFETGSSGEHLFEHRPRFGDESGGWKVLLADNQGNHSYVWVRYSKTEPSQCRVYIDSRFDEETIALLNKARDIFMEAEAEGLKNWEDNTISYETLAARISGDGVTSLRLRLPGVKENHIEDINAVSPEDILAPYKGKNLYYAAKDNVATIMPGRQDDGNIAQPIQERSKALEEFLELTEIKGRLIEKLSSEMEKRGYALVLHPEPLGDDAKTIKGRLMELGFDENKIKIVATLQDAQEFIDSHKDEILVVVNRLPGVNLANLIVGLDIQDVSGSVASGVPETAKDINTWL